ncbi:NAD-dependent epimerase/dehydratase family protein [Phaeobacter porticola]|uniref:NAD dependent epimerase/dehydratase n=1 Tax=Phaeobacter porticola TaxID=1844006 RepID=A0A1L3I1Z7_9RHOB|nr:NAD(P)-dependent oxidoreductase [Phaeobacter porticola]APG46139.1 NAD dependent epimerase/dehydratase [Phaeobacter porticola]
MDQPHFLLTGSTGFVGRAVTQELHAANVPVRHVIRRGTVDRLATLGPQDSVVECDDVFAQPADWWTEVATGCETLLHLAWYAEPGKYQLSPRNFDCLCGTLQIAEGAIQAGVARFVGTGTCLEYDLRGGEVSAQTRLDPQSPYAAAKAACALSLGQLLPQAGMSFLWARLFYLYGAGEDPRRLTAYIHRQLAAGEAADLSAGDQIRDFLDVRDAARLLVREALSARTGATNISSGRGVSVRALAEQIADGYGRRDLLRFGVRPGNPDDPPVVIGLREGDTDAAPPDHVVAKRVGAA